MDSKKKEGFVFLYEKDMLLPPKRKDKICEYQGKKFEETSQKVAYRSPSF